MLNIFLLFCSSVVLNAESHADDFWYDMGDSSWETSNYLASYNPYYNMYRQSAAQMDWYTYAQHVGKINRGQSVNPELNMPRHRAFGYQSDFNPQDLKSGGFNYKVHVNLELANHVGKVLTIPIGHHVQEDGSVLVEISPGQRSPCHPDPCKHLAFSTCSTVNDVTAKCSDHTTDPGFPGTTLFATCDNFMKVFLDGELAFQDEKYGEDTYQWKITTELDIPRGTKVLGIECLDIHVAKGILASTANGMVSDGSWECSTKQHLEGWADPGFIDTNGDFASPLTFGLNGASPWGFRPEISASAEWIWPGGPSRWAACKKTLV